MNMKTFSLIRLLLSVLIIVSISKSSYSQKSEENCRVLLHPINDSYEGGCKKGFAHGKGIAKGKDLYEGKFKMGLPHGIGKYTWANGNTYTGGWKKGKMNGVGTYYSASNGEDLKGIWEENEFIKEYKGPAYNITYKSTSIEKVNIYALNGGIPGTIDIELRRDGYKNHNFNYIFLNGMTGMQETSSNFIGFKGVAYPFEGNVKFQALSRTGITTINYSLDFVINDKGAWKVIIYY